MRDGIYTSADVYMPDDESPCPVVLNRTPYGNHVPNKAQIGEILVRQGYIYVTEDVRGRGDSDGREPAR